MRTTQFAIIMAVVLNVTPASATPPPRMTIPFRAVGSTVLLPVSVNGSEPGWFILDSGANSCVIAKDFANRLGLHPTSGGEATGAGKGTVPYDRYEERVRFTVGGLPLECPKQHVIGLDFSNQPEVIGTAIEGVLGTDFFSTYVIEIDYSRRVVRAFDPSGFSYTGSGARVPMTVNAKRLPYIEAVLTVDSRETATRPLLVDSGSQDAVDDDWVLRSANLRTATGGVGTGQPFQVRMGRFSKVEIGPFKLTDVPGGGGGVPLVGGEVLRHFTVIFDWPHRQLILEPSAGFAGSLADSGTPGFGLRANRDGTVRVEFVSTGAPAALAGLMEGDVITAVDGTPSAHFDFSQLSNLFRRDRSYRLNVRRRGQQRIFQLDF
ncbi:MAG: aspartyl protease family protein [Sphingomonas sp.]|nr:aspartyl protease family protein [Sphingomonas sp.]